MESQVHDCGGDPNPHRHPPTLQGLSAGGTAGAAWSAGVPATALGSLSAAREVDGQPERAPDVRGTQEHLWGGGGVPPG